MILICSKHVDFGQEIKGGTLFVFACSCIFVPCSGRGSDYRDYEILVAIKTSLNGETTARLSANAVEVKENESIFKCK